jgi:hypothetical protein
MQVVCKGITNIQRKRYVKRVKDVNHIPLFIRNYYPSDTFPFFPKCGIQPPVSPVGGFPSGFPPSEGLREALTPLTTTYGLPATIYIIGEDSATLSCLFSLMLFYLSGPVATWESSTGHLPGVLLPASSFGRAGPNLYTIMQAHSLLPSPAASAPMAGAGLKILCKIISSKQLTVDGIKDSFIIYNSKKNLLNYIDSQSSLVREGISPSFPLQGSCFSVSRGQKEMKNR